MRRLQELQRAFIYGVSKSSAVEEIVRYGAGLCSFCKLSSSRSLQGSNRRVRISTEVVTPGRPDCVVDLGSQIISYHSIVIELVLAIGGSRKMPIYCVCPKASPLPSTLYSYPHKSCSGVKPARFSHLKSEQLYAWPGAHGSCN